MPRASESEDGTAGCPRCATARRAGRWCELCGLDFSPDLPRRPDAESFAAQGREQRWYREHPEHASRELEEQREREADASALMTPEPEPPGVESRPPAPIEHRLQPQRGHWLALKSEQNARFDLCDDRENLVGRIMTGDLHGPPVLEAAAHAWQPQIVSRRLGWYAVVRRPSQDAPLAGYRPSWRSGGRLWLAPDSRYAMRAWLGTWTLRTSDRHRVAQLHSFPGRGLGRLEVELQDACDQPSLALLILFSCWVVLIENAVRLPRGGGGAGGDGGGFHLPHLPVPHH